MSNEQISEEIKEEIRKIKTSHTMLARDMSRFENSVTLIGSAITELVEIKRDFAHFIKTTEENNRHHAQRHDKQDVMIEKISERQGEVDALLPPLIEMRSWFLGGIGFVVVSVMGALVALVLK